MVCSLSPESTGLVLVSFAVSGAIGGSLTAHRAPDRIERKGIMITTSRRVLLGSGVAALALTACSGEGATGLYEATSTSTAGGTSPEGGMGGIGGAGGSGGEGGSMEIPELEVFKCFDVVIEPRIIGAKDDWMYHPSEVTLSVGQVLQFKPEEIVMNMQSGTPPKGDGKFYTPQGVTRCLRFNVPGTYPFFCDAILGPPMTGTVIVQ